MIDLRASMKLVFVPEKKPATALDMNCASQESLVAYGLMMLALQFSGKTKPSLPLQDVTRKICTI